ncbi:MAG: hypothetical protein MJ248_03810 [Bacilli bacterium]|nr:hypothetical protein [Bacilli bacterium]
MFTLEELNEYRKNLKISRIVTYSLLGAFIIFLTLSFIFVSRENRNFMLPIMIVVSSLLLIGFIFGLFYLLFYKEQVKFFKFVLTGEETEIISEVTYIDQKAYSLDFNKKVYQINIIKDEETYVVYLYSVYHNALVESKTYKFVLRGNFIISYEEYVS